REAGNMAPFKAPEEAFIKITVAPQGLAGTAVIQYAVWNLKAPTQRDTLTLNIVVNWGASVQEQVAGTARVYPNPAAGFVHVFNPAQEPVQAVLRSIDGKQLGNVVTVAPSREVQLPMKHLPSGVYLVALHSETYNTVIRVVHP
ncbi:MAG: Secretion system C-terminal sorting domain, partial [Bacteroidota bacterium]